MSRSLRIEYPGAFFHVMNRGVARQSIFQDEVHYLYFLELLEEIHRLFQIETHAYCLMGNHYHLLIRIWANNLSEAIRHLNGLYAKFFNKTMNRDGPLFRGRFKSILVQNESYFIQVGRYIHCNPIEANIVKMPEHYKWSSYQYYLHSEQKPSWLYCNETLSYFNDKRSSYKKYVSDGIDEDTEIFFQSNSPLPIFGSETFVKHTAKENKIVPNNEITGATKIFKIIQCSIAEVVKMIAVEHNTEVENIINSQTKNEQQLRSKAIYICVRHARKTHQAISNFFKGVSRSNVSHICKRLDNKIGTNNELVDEIMKIVTVL